MTQAETIYNVLSNTANFLLKGDEENYVQGKRSYICHAVKWSMKDLGITESYGDAHDTDVFKRIQASVFAFMGSRWLTMYDWVEENIECDPSSTLVQFHRRKLIQQLTDRALLVIILEKVKDLIATHRYMFLCTSVASAARGLRANYSAVEKLHEDIKSEIGGCSTAEAYLNSIGSYHDVDMVQYRMALADKLIEKYKI